MSHLKVAWHFHNLCKFALCMYVHAYYVQHCMLMSVIVCACMCSLFVHSVECVCTRVYMYVCLVFVHGACVRTRVCVCVPTYV